MLYAQICGATHGSRHYSYSVCDGWTLTFFKWNSPKCQSAVTKIQVFNLWDVNSDISRPCLSHWFRQHRVHQGVASKFLSYLIYFFFFFEHRAARWVNTNYRWYLNSHNISPGIKQSMPSAGGFCQQHVKRHAECLQFPSNLHLWHFFFLTMWSIV